MREPPFDSEDAAPNYCPLCGRPYESKRSSRHRLVLQDEAAGSFVRNERLGGQLCGRCWRRIRARLGAVGDQARN